MSQVASSRSARSGIFSRKLLAAAAATLAIAGSADAAFTITLNFTDTTTTQQRQAFNDAKTYWESVISGYSTSGALSGITIDADVTSIDGLSGILGSASPTHSTVQGGITYTDTGHMQFDSADVNSMIADNTFGDVIRHEMGHVLGIGTQWSSNALRAPGNNFRYVGANALAAWQIEFDQLFDTWVPIEGGGGAGTAGSHWNEVDGGTKPTGIVSKFMGRDFEYELMTGWANSPVFTSNVTVGSIVDMGYTIKGPSATNGAYNFNRDFLTAPASGANDFNIGRTGRHGMMVWSTLTGANSLSLNNVDADTVVALMGANDYTGGTTVSAGTLIVGNMSALGTGSVTVNGGTLDLFGFDITVAGLTLAGGKITGSEPGFTFTGGSITSATDYDLRAGDVDVSLNGTVAINKTTGGVVTLSQSNAHTGGTNVLGGTLIAADTGALSTGTVKIDNGASLLLEGNFVGVGVVTLENGTLGVSGDNGGSIGANSFILKSGTVSAAITSGSVSKEGSGTVTLSGANTFNSGTTVFEGTLALANTSALGSGTTTVSGGTLDVGTTAVVTSGNVILNTGSIVGTGGSLTANTYAVRSGTISAVLAGSGSMTKTDVGTVTLSGDNTFTGGVTVSDGTLVGAAANSLGAGAVTLQGGTTRLDDAAAAAKAGLVLSGGALSFGTLTQAVAGSIAGTADLALVNDNAAAVALTVGGNGASTSYSGILSGAGSLTKTGSGELTLTGVNTYSGGTTVSAGTLTMGNANAIGSGSVVVNGGTLNIGAFNLSTGPFLLDGGAVVGTSGTLNAASYDLRAGTVGVQLTGGPVVKSGSGDLTLSLANTYTGGTTVNAGRLVVGAAGALSNGPVTVNGGILDIGANTMLGMDVLTLAGGSVVGTTGGYVASAFDVRSGSVSARLQGSGALTKTTSGTVVLSGANGFAGGVNVNEGVLVITNSSALGSGATAVASGATLRVGDGSTAFGGVWNGTAIALNGGTLELALASTTTVNRTISGTGGVVQNGSGTVTLTGASYSGDTVVNAGRLVLPAANLPTGALVTNGDGTLAIAGNGSTINFTRNVTGAGTLAFIGNGTTRLLNGSTLAHTGELDIESGQKFSLGTTSGESASLDSRLVVIRSGARFSGSGNIAGSLANAGTLSPGFSPGTITLGGNFANTGTLTMETDVATGAHDQIRFAGQAVLGGTLNLVYLNGTLAKGTIVDFLVDTDTSDGRPSLVGNFASVVLPAGGGIVYNTGSGLNFIAGGTLYDIPGANISPRLASMADALGGVTDPAIANALSPVTQPVASLANSLANASPLGLASAVALPVAEAWRDTDELRRHLDGRRFERFSAQDYGWAPYVSGNGLTVKSKAGNDSPTFDYYTFGGHVGVDKSIGDELTLGGRVAYDSACATFHTGGGRLEQDHVRATFYGTKLISGKFYVDAGVFGGASIYDVRQNTVLGADKADSTGWDAGLFANAGMVAPLTSNISLTPHAGFTYTHVNVGALNETGSSLALNVSQMNYDSFAGRIGSGVNCICDVAGTPVRLGVDASYVRELLDNEIDIDAAFAGSPGSSFKTGAVVAPIQRLEIGPELDIQVAPGHSITASYKFEYAFGDATGHRFDIGYRARF